MAERPTPVKQKRAPIAVESVVASFAMVLGDVPPARTADAVKTSALPEDYPSSLTRIRMRTITSNT